MTILADYLSDPVNLRGFLQEKAILSTTTLLEQVMREEGVSRSELANLLGGKSKAWVTQLLDGEGNKTIRTVADVLAVLGREFECKAPRVKQLASSDPPILSFHESWSGDQRQWEIAKTKLG